MKVLKTYQHGLPRERKLLRGFTLLELLVVLVIIGILVTIGTFAIQGARESARDAKRKADLSNISSALELFRSDCNQYPDPAGAKVPSPLKGIGSPISCNAANVYMDEIPTDPQTGKLYGYIKPSATTYLLCASLEGVTTGAIPACGSTCGSGVCNYVLNSP